MKLSFILLSFTVLCGFQNAQSTLQTENSPQSVHFLPDTINNQLHQSLKYFTADNNLDINTETLTFGDYRCEKELGKGAFGKVYAGVHISTGQKVAIKVGNEHAYKGYMKKEVRNMELVNDAPNVVKFLAYFQEEKEGKKVDVIVMEFFEGKMLKAIRQELSKFEQKSVMYQVLRTLAYANEHNVLHDDTHSDNIMVNLDNFEVRVIDWGQSRYFPDGIPETLLTPNQDVKHVGLAIMELMLNKRFNFAVSKEEFTQLVNERNLLPIDPDVEDLLAKLGAFEDIKQSITAKEALEHPYFKITRNFNLSEMIRLGMARHKSKADK